MKAIIKVASVLGTAAICFTYKLTIVLTGFKAEQGSSD